jgi:hypothetical protein
MERKRQLHSVLTLYPRHASYSAQQKPIELLIRIDDTVFTLKRAKHLDNLLRSEKPYSDVVSYCDGCLNATALKQFPLFPRQYFQSEVSCGVGHATLPLDFAPNISDHLPKFFEHSKYVSERKTLPIGKSLLELNRDDRVIPGFSFLSH